jgi:hypothetical protein
LEPRGETQPMLEESLLERRTKKGVTTELSFFPPADDESRLIVAFSYAGSS